MRPALFGALGLAALAFAVFLPVGGFAFLNFDDGGHVTSNEVVQRGLTRDSLAYAFSETGTNLWHPFTWLSHMLDCELFGLDAGWHHRTNLALHAANGVLLFLFLQLATRRAGRSFAVAALFLIHPAHVESVAWISERKDLLCAFFWMLTLLLYRWYSLKPGTVRYGAVSVAFIMALLSKPMAVTLPVVLLVLDYWPLRRWGTGSGESSTPRPGGQLLIEKLPWLAIAVLFSVLTIYFQSRGSHAGSIDAHGPAVRMALAISAYGAYAVKLFLPLSLAPDYPYPDPLSLLKVLLIGLAGMAFTTWSVLGRRRRPWLLAGWCWFLVVLAPVSGIFELGGIFIADRYTYLSYAGLFVALVWGVSETGARFRVPAVVPAAIAVAVTIVLAFATRAQLQHWRDSEALFGHTLAVHPSSRIARTNLGIALRDRGDLEGAKRHFRILSEEHPEFHLGYYNLGRLEARLDRFAEAESLFRAALECAPGHVPSLIDLSTALARQGRASEARPFLRRALEIEPGNTGIRRRLESLGTEGAQ